MKTISKLYFPTQYWHDLDDGRVVCDLCPKHCALREGKRGACYIRMNYQGEIVLTSYGRSSGFCIDPIEKKPLNHFYPGSKVLSFGTAGCNLSCQFCQNWEISKSRQVDTLSDKAMPEQLAQAAFNYGCQSIAFTYNDPVIFLEYARDAAIAAKEKGVKTVAVTAAYICEKPRKAFFEHIDAANVDLKAFSTQFYKKRCHADLQVVLDTLLYLKHETHVWFEITCLLIPGENDSEGEIHQMCEWIANKLGSDIPLHFSAFHPDFKMRDKPATPLSTLLMARNIALNYGLKYVYCGNVHDIESDTTYCPYCHSRLIERDWYQLKQYALNGTGHCLNCGYLLHGHFNEQHGDFGPRRISIKIS